MNLVLKILYVCSIFIPRGLFSADSWISFKNETISKMETIPGWCPSEKGHLIMDIIKENKCRFCVEIGVFSGRSLFPIAKTLQYNGLGKVFAIDAWNTAEATRGFDNSDPNHAWWSELDLDYFHKQTLNLVYKDKLERFCRIINQTSQSMAQEFSNETIDFIHFDGNHNEEIAFQDITNYFPKIKDGGFILLNDPNWLSMQQSLIFLLERADLISSFTPSAGFVS